MFRGFQNLLRLPGAKLLALMSIITRSTTIPLGAAYTTIGYSVTDSWLWAGAVGGIASLAAALSFWFTGKMIDRFGAKIVLLTLAPGSLAPLFYGNGDLIWVLFVSLLAGFLRPPNGTVVRSAWQVVAKTDQERVLAYSFDAAIAPIAGALGALLAGGLYALFSTQGVILFLVIGTLVPAIALALFAFSPESKTNSYLKKQPLGTKTWAAISIVGSSWIALVAVEMSLGVFFGEEALLLSNAVGLVAVAIGALLFTNTNDQTGRQALITASFGAGITLVLTIIGASLLPIVIWGLIFILGIFRGLISSAASTYITYSSPESRRSEALALYGSSVLVGQAGYRPLAGFLSSSPVLLPVLPALIFFYLYIFIKKDD